MDLWIVVRPAVVTQLWRGSVKCPLYCETTSTVKRANLAMTAAVVTVRRIVDEF